MPQTADASRLRSRGYEVVRTREVFPGERMLQHHEHYEVAMVWDGAMSYRVGDRVYHLTNGDIVLIAPGEPHQPIPEADQGICERVLLWIDRAGMGKLRAFGYDPSACFNAADPDRRSCLRFDNEASWRIGELLDRCIRESESAEEGAGMMADAIMMQVLILINRLHRRTIRSVRRDRSEALVSGVLAYINEHYADELTLDSLANRFFISKYHLSREFGRIVGRSVHRYITQKRLVVAKQMLVEGRPSSAVYQHCGFGDYSNFYRAFRREYGVSPKAYAAALREDAARNAPA